MPRNTPTEETALLPADTGRPDPTDPAEILRRMNRIDTDTDPAVYTAYWAGPESITDFLDRAAGSAAIHIVVDTLDLTVPHIGIRLGRADVRRIIVHSRAIRLGGDTTVQISAPDGHDLDLYFACQTIEGGQLLVMAQPDGEDGHELRTIQGAYQYLNIGRGVVTAPDQPVRQPADPAIWSNLYGFLAQTLRAAYSPLAGTLARRQSMLCWIEATAAQLPEDQRRGPHDNWRRLAQAASAGMAASGSVSMTIHPIPALTSDAYAQTIEAFAKLITKYTNAYRILKNQQTTLEQRRNTLSEMTQYRHDYATYKHFDTMHAAQDV